MDKLISKLKTMLKDEDSILPKSLGGIVIFLWYAVTFAYIGNYLSGEVDLILKQDKKYLLYILLCIPVILMAIQLILDYFNKIIFSVNTIFVIALFVSISVFSIKSFYVSRLKQMPFVTTNAIVVNDDIVRKNRRRVKDFRVRYLTLRFADEETITLTMNRVAKNSNIHKGNCFMLRYRKNAWLTEIRLIEDLGKMSMSECFAQDNGQ